MKRAIFSLLKNIHTDILFRYLNRKKVMILAYHGVTRKIYDIPPWTQIPFDIFEEQIKHVSQRYNVISLQQAVESVISGERLPKNPAVITFDDGYKNNYTVALPLLQKYDTPATVFVTAGYIGSDRILPMDEAYLMLTNARNQGPITLSEMELGTFFFETHEDIWKGYLKVYSFFKRLPTNEQRKYLGILRNSLGEDYDEISVKEDFLLLSWEEIRALMETDLIQIGAHTVSHEILTNLSLKEAAKQIVGSKSIIQEHLGCDVILFAYPNGTEADYNDGHIKCLRKNGFICSVTTTPRLNKVHEDLYRLGRICIGPDFSAHPNHFILNTSGFISVLRALVNRIHVI